ncbi:MAG: Flp pilus assembly protein CpaB [Candidatus Dadabacteria bacterium]|nr:MAG: Flp pilus assembly protein CpaB [Candidatus Dadabacteria bacterium]
MRRATAKKRTSKRRNKGTAIGAGIIAFAILAGAVVVRTSQVSQPKPVRVSPVVGQFDTVSIPVPAEFVPAGTKIKNVHFRRVSFPKHQIPPKAIRDITPYMESVAVAPLPANLPLFPENLSLTAGVVNPVIEKIPEGMRAITVRVDATSAVEGWAGSGSIVDVLLVTKDKTTVVAEKVKILSAERSVSPIDGSASPKVPKTVTLLVTQEQALAINTAANIGKLAFALRSVKDDGNWIKTFFSADNITAGPVRKKNNAVVSGYVEVSSNKKNKKKFVLVNGKWLSAEAKPQGFFVSKEE